MALSFEKRIALSTTPLVSPDARGIPVDFASGCLIDYSGCRILLTVFHATGNGGNWAIQEHFDPEKGTTCLIPLYAVNNLIKGSLATFEFEDVDFSYVKISEEVQPMLQDIDPISRTVIDEETITIHKPSLESLPIPGVNYGFGGMVRPKVEYHPMQVLVGPEPRGYHGLTFVRTEGDYHHFKLPMPHPGHDYFKGCSGAPIISEAGEWLKNLAANLLMLPEGFLTRLTLLWQLAETDIKRSLENP